MDKLTTENIVELENALGVSLPQDVVQKYLVTNGVRGPTECQFLYTFQAQEETDIVRINKLIHGEEWFPKEFASLILLGDDGCGSFIALDASNQRVVLWHPEDGNEIQEARQTATEMWQYIEILYENEA